MTYPCLRGFGLLLSLCLSGALCAADYSKWRCYRVLQFDTTAAGADVAGDVKDFPLAVGLTAANFDFATAKPDGSDLRFTNDKDDAPLPHAVEHWDAQAKSALVWVKVPLIRGNRSDQVLFMQWQNPEAERRAAARGLRHERRFHRCLSPR